MDKSMPIEVIKIDALAVPELLKPFCSEKGNSPDSVANAVSPRPKDYESSLVALSDAYETIRKLNKEVSQQKAKIRQMELYIEEHEPFDLGSSAPTAACGVGWMLDRTGRRSRTESSSTASPSIRYDLELSLPFNVANPAGDSVAATPLASSVSCTSTASPRNFDFSTPKYADSSNEHTFEGNASMTTRENKGIAHRSGVARSASYAESDLGVLVDSSTPTTLMSQSTKQNSQVPKSMVDKLSSTVCEVRRSASNTPTDELPSPDTSVGTVPSLLIRQKSTDKLKMISKKYRAASFDNADEMTAEETKCFNSSMLNSKSSTTVAFGDDQKLHKITVIPSPVAKVGVGRRQLLGRVDASKTMVSLTSLSDGRGYAMTQPSPVHRASSTSNIDVSSLHSQSVAVGMGAASAKWCWKDSKDVFLFIYHDNPQLGSTVSMSIRCKDSASGTSKDSVGPEICNAAVPMDIMIETKDLTGQTFFLIGEIVFSGAIQLIEGCEDNSNSPRGSSCMVCTKLKAVKSNLKSFPTRNAANSTEIIEFDLNSGPCAVVDIQSNEQLVQWLSGCSSRVDVILDPYHTGTWYPYWEGTRKMAPQFRSRGIGYLRLGDDMSQFGIGFMSLDAGLSYLDAGACGGLQETNIVEEPAASDTAACVEEGEPPALDVCGNRQFVVVIQDVLSKLSTNMASKDNKWQERVQLFSSLSSALLESTEIKSKSVVCSNLNREVSTVLLEYITKQKNPHALKSVVECVGSAGLSGRFHIANNSLIWRSLLLEVMALLRSANKLVVEAAKDMLNALFLDSHTDLREDEWNSVKDVAAPVLTSIKSQTSLKVQHGGKAGVNTNSLTNSMGCSLFFIISLLPELFKPCSGPRGANPCKLLQWLSNVFKKEVKYAHDAICDANVSTIHTTATSEQHAVMFGVCKGFMAHKDAAARDASIELMCFVLALDCLVTTRSEKISDTSTDRNEIVIMNFATYLSPAISEVYSSVLSTVKHAEDKLVKGARKILQEYSTNGLLDFQSKGPGGGDSSSASQVQMLITENVRGAKSVTSHSPQKTNVATTDGKVSKGRFKEDRRKGSLNILSNAWFEIRLTMKHIPSTEIDWNAAVQVSSGGVQFFVDLTRIAEETCKISRSALMREILPFDENTSSNDQSLVIQSVDFERLVSSCYADSTIRQEKANGLGLLQRQAINIRKLIRVKMADESDLKQAQDTLSMISRFVARVQDYCDEFHSDKEPTSQFDVVRVLENEYK